MWKQSRRDFLVSSAAGALALPAGMLLAAPAAKPIDMAIARWAGAKDLSNAQIDQAAGKMAERAIEALGGMKRFVKRGDVVWIKPNIGWDRKPEQAACTNPEIVAALVRLAFDAGAKTVKMGDNPVHPAGKTYESSGIAAAAKAAGAKVVYLDKSRFRKAAIGGEKIREIPVYPEIMDCDLVINVPLVKHHVLSSLTMCMKNYLGVVENRQIFHQDLPVCIADITRYMRAQSRLHLLEGVRILTGHGPTGGNLSDVQVKMTLAAGTDIVALDAWGAELIGKKPGEIGSIVHGQKVGLGKLDYRSLALREIAVS
jgi:uncharacterized protein (DUF362 family)